MSKIYECCICHKILEIKPIRLVKQIYGAGNYNQYYPVSNYDFCEDCYKKFNNWINKHRRENERQKETNL